MQPAVQDFIEKHGLLWEEDGMPRIAGRIYALMLISPEECSLDDIATSLNVSKASVSNDARLLERFGFIERVSKPGDRRDYYRVSDDSLQRTLAVRLKSLHAMDALLDEAQRLPIKRPEVKQRLAAHRETFGTVVAALQDVLDRINSKRQWTSRS